MTSDALPRDAFVQALDDLGEREKLVEVWMKEADAPYPPEVIRKRSKRLRWRLRLKRAPSSSSYLWSGSPVASVPQAGPFRALYSDFCLDSGGMFAVTSLFTDP